MKAKKFEMTVNYGEGEVTEVGYFTLELDNKIIEQELIFEEYSYGPTPIVSYAGLVELEETLGNDFKLIGYQYHTKNDWSTIMNDMMEDVCPGGQGYDK